MDIGCEQGINQPTKEQGEKYEKVFQADEMRTEKRIISHANRDSKIERVIDKDGTEYSVSQALEKKIDWIQIDIGYLSEQEKNTVLDLCSYAVVNGSHTVMGEILGGKAKPIIGIPIYDEHTNQILWAEKKNLGIMAKNTHQVISAINKIKKTYNEYQENLKEFSKNFVGNGAEKNCKDS